MALKTYNPTSPGQRQLVLVDRSELHKGRPVKALTEGLSKTGGRNNRGRMTARHKMKPLKGAQMVRSAGCYAQLIGRDAGYAQIKLTSGEVRMVLDACVATIGAVSNPDNMNQVMSKAGRNRNKGKRPHVRGVVMNPVDHPHGGGEGKSSGGRHPVTPWGKKTRGPKTRKTKASDRLIVRRRNAKR
jgi:large subunit ribosomal protein L2